ARLPWLAGLAAVAALAGAVIYVRTDTGLIEIEAEDNAKVSIERGGKEVQVVNVKDRYSLRIGTGEYQLKVLEGDKDLEVKPDHVVLSRGGAKVVSLRRVAPPPTPAITAKDSPPLDEAWRRRVAGLPAEK